jgi:hypothetical protein
MSLGFNVLLRNAQLDQLTSFAGAGALIRIYSGSRPATGGALSGNTLLAQLTMNATFAPGASSGVLTANAISSDLSAKATGTAVWFRIVKADGTTHVMDGDVSTVVAGTGDMRIDNTSIVLGGTVAMSSAVFTAGNP